MLLLSIDSYTQCPSGTIILSSQSEVDDFATDYPSCTDTNGSLIIYTDSDINDLSPLSDIENISGSLVISGDFGDPSQLTNLDGLNIITLNSLSIIENQALTEIDALSSVTTIQNGSIAIYDNPLLTNLDGLANIVPEGNGNTGELDGNLLIYNNPLVTSLDVLDNITQVNFELDISEMPGLSNLNGLDNITEAGELNIGDNPNLTSLNGLSGLTEIASFARIKGNSSLTNLSGLNNLVEVGNTFTISGNDQLTSLSGLNSLTQVGTNLPSFGSGGHLDITENQNLNSLNGLNALEDTGGNFSITGLDNLTDITALTSLTSVGGGLIIGDNDALTDLTGLHNVTEANANGNSLIGVLIAGNELLPNLDGLSGLTDVTNRLEINFNPNLDNINGLSNLSTVNSITLIDNNIIQDLTGLEGVNTSNVTLKDNPALQSLNGLNNITTLGNLDIDNNSSLTDISALSNATTVGGFLEIKENPSLTTLNGLENITSVGNRLHIKENNSLNDLSALNSLTSIGFDLSIFSNQNLIQIDGFNSLNSVAGRINISGHDNLVSIDGFNNLSQLDDGLNIGANDSLIEINGFSSLNQIGKSLDIENNDVLNHIYAFENLSTVGNSFDIRENNTLENLNAFKNLTTIGGTLRILQNSSLNDITGLRQLEAIGTQQFDLQAGIFIQFNDSLTSLNGLQNLDMSTVDGIYMQSNSELSLCNLTNFCNYLSNSANFRVISGNLGNCADDTAILNVCSSCTSTTTWDGTAWSNGTPNATTKAVFDANYTETGSLETCDLEVRPNDTLNIEGVLKINGNLDNFGEVIFKSYASGNGQLDEVLPTSIIDCNILTERFIPAGDNNRRAFRFVASPVNTVNSIRENWQEDPSSNTDNPNPGFGTHITGSTTDGLNGFDGTASGNPSLLLFDNSSQTWNPIDNTNRNTLDYDMPYNLFVRGDRSIDLTSGNQVPTNTVLRARGKLAAGEIDKTPFLAASNSEFSFLSNPYQAIVDFNALTFSGGINSNHLFIWNPNASTNGAYEVIDNLTPSQQMLQPGQSFFVQNSASVSTPPGLIFTESSKNTTGTITSVFSENNIAVANLELYNDNNTRLDVVKFRLEAEASNGIDDFDAGKLLNPTENLASVNSSTLLAIERLDMAQNEYTAPLYIDQYQGSNYEFRLNLNNWNDDITLYIIDNYLNTETLIDGTQTYMFSVDPAIAESIASDRFSLKFDNTTLGLSENILSEDIRLYPNPSSNGIFNLKIKDRNLSDCTISIFDLSGRQVLSPNRPDSSNQVISVNASTLSPGVYVIKVEQNGEEFTAKLILK
jgi:acyl-[acyl carrier protein]--UDP-N-acetylglucosamine O-acyltransferase